MMGTPVRSAKVRVRFSMRIDNMTLQTSLSNPLWLSHKIGHKYTMDGAGCWKIAYYPIFEDGKTKELYQEARALIETPLTNGTDFREVPLRYLKFIR